MAVSPGQTDAPATSSREQWRTSEKCPDWHARSTWGTCDECDGQGVREFDICGCAYGLMETGPLRAEP